jgi:hypothetical protein
MTHRKRRRQPASSSTEDDSDSSNTGSHTAVSKPCHQPACPPAAAALSMRRRRRRGRHPQRLAFLKLAAATLLLWLCDNGHHHHTLVDAWGSSKGGNSTVTKKGLQLVATCSQADFVVNAVYLVCDSPGAYYRGSTTYRDSALCIYGDKARLKLECKQGLEQSKNRVVTQAIFHSTLNRFLLSFYIARFVRPIMCSLYSRFHSAGD